MADRRVFSTDAWITGVRGDERSSPYLSVVRCHARHAEHPFELLMNYDERRKLGVYWGDRRYRLVLELVDEDEEKQRAEARRAFERSG